jgi:hypothetical protein
MHRIICQAVMALLLLLLLLLLTLMPMCLKIARALELYEHGCLGQGRMYILLTFAPHMGADV